MQICQHIQAYASIQLCKYAHICKYAGMQVCKYASMQVCEYGSMRVCISSFAKFLLQENNLQHTYQERKEGITAEDIQVKPCLFLVSSKCIFAYRRFKAIFFYLKPALQV